MGETETRVELLKKEIMRSQWPKCDGLAQALVAIGSDDARGALVLALEARRHHVRTAAIRGLVSLGAVDAVQYIERHLDDASYETRMAAKTAVKVLTGRDVSTGRGE
jgi:HEAT repeat protein